MLRREYKLKQRNDISNVFKEGDFFGSKFIRLKTLKNGLEISRFVFVVGAKISKKAVVRNKIKRQLNKIIQDKLLNIKTGFDVMVLPSPAIIDKKYLEIKEELVNLFKKANLIK